MYLNFPHVWPREVSLHDIIPPHPFPCLFSLTKLLSSFLFLLHPFSLHPFESFFCAVFGYRSPAVTHGNAFGLLAYLFYQPYPVICLSLNYSCNWTLSAWLYKGCFPCLAFSFLNMQPLCCFSAFLVSNFPCSANQNPLSVWQHRQMHPSTLLLLFWKLNWPFLLTLTTSCLFSHCREPSTDLGRGQRSAHYP